MEKEKTLADYLKWGKHELVAFVNGNKLNTKDEGNLLGESNLGVLVFEKRFTDDEFDQREDGVSFVYKKKSIYSQDTDIMVAKFCSSKAKVVSEVPLGIVTRYFTDISIPKGNRTFKHSRTFFKEHNLPSSNLIYKEAKKLLQKYGLY